MVAILSNIGARFRAAHYKARVRTLARCVPYYAVNEYPKCGGTWLSQMLADAMCLPFYRNRMPQLRPGIIHGHFLSPLGLANCVVVWRDPRDLCVSLYHHCYFENELHNAPLVQKMKQRLPFRDYTQVSENLPAFIRHISETPFAPRFTWDAFVSNWAERCDVTSTSYEALRLNTPRELTRIVHELSKEVLEPSIASGISKHHSIENAKRRASQQGTNGTEVSFVREGAVGGWRRYFNAEAMELAQKYWARGLERLGYDQ